MPISQEDYDLIVGEIEAGNLSTAEINRALPMLEEYKQSQQQEATPRFNTAQNYKEAAGVAGQTLTSVLGGTADFVLGMGEALADLNPMWNADRIANKREEVKQGAATINRDLYEWAAGRELLPQESQDIMQSTAKTVDAASTVFKLGAGLAGGAAAVGGKTFLGAVGIGTLEGAATGMLLGEAEEDSSSSKAMQRVGDAGVGAAFGAIAGLIPAVAAGGKNIFSRIVKKSSETPHFKEGEALFDEFGLFGSLGQKGGHPVIMNIEQNAKGLKGLEMLRMQQEALPYRMAAKAGVRLRSMEEIGEEGADDLARGIKAMQKELGAMKGAKNKEWRQATAALNAKYGGAEVLSSKGLAAEADDIAASFADDPGKYGIRPWAVKMLDKLRDGSNLTAKELGELQVDLNQVKNGTLKMFDDPDYVPTAQALAGRLNQALKTSIRQAPDSPALNELKALRSAYEESATKIGKLEGDMLKSIGFSDDPAKTLKMLQKAPDKVSRSAMKLLDEMDGGQMYKESLNKAMFDEAVMTGQRAAAGKAGRTGDLDISAFEKALSKGTRRSVFSGIMDTDKERTVQNGLKLARRVMNDPDAMSKAGVMKTQLGVDAQGIFINAVSRDPGFVARLLAGAVTRGKGADWLFFTKEGQDMLKTLGTARVAGRAVTAPATVRNAAILSTLSMLKEGAREEMEQAQQETP